MSRRFIYNPIYRIGHAISSEGKRICCQVKVHFQHRVTDISTALYALDIYVRSDRLLISYASITGMGSVTLLCFWSVAGLHALHHIFNLVKRFIP